MKRLITLLCLVLFTLIAATGYSQNAQGNRPSLFSNYPSTIIIPAAKLNNLFAASQGDNVALSLTNNFTLAGPVTSKLVKYSNLETMVIKLPAFNNTLFSFSKQTDQNNNGLYVGRILNPLYADGYELSRNPDGNYQFTKIDIEKIVVNCNQ